MPKAKVSATQLALAFPFHLEFSSLSRACPQPSPNTLDHLSGELTPRQPFPGKSVAPGTPAAGVPAAGPLCWQRTGWPFVAREGSGLSPPSPLAFASFSLRP